jgi:hypothetical protein
MSRADLSAEPRRIHPDADRIISVTVLTSLGGA